MAFSMVSPSSQMESSRRKVELWLEDKSSENDIEVTEGGLTDDSSGFSE